MTILNDPSMTCEPGSKSVPVYVLRNVNKVYRMGENTVAALREVSMEIHPGELVVIVGPSGSGKSTLLNILGGLDTPTAGEVWYRDRELSHLSPTELTEFRRDAIGFVFQFYNLIADLTVRENVQLASEISVEPLDIDETLALVGLGDRVDHFPSQLSGGQQQRVAIARAVVKNPGLILCDEPTGALDFETGKRVLEVLVQLARELGKTVVIVTHNLAIGRLADTVIRMRDGSILEKLRNDVPASPQEIDW
jgi:putative ABC transport system ATP-binding protein